MRDQGGTIWLTGLSGAGKTTIARLVEAELRRSAQRVEVLDGDAPLIEALMIEALKAYTVRLWGRPSAWKISPE